MDPQTTETATKIRRGPIGKKFLVAFCWAAGLFLASVALTRQDAGMVPSLVGASTGGLIAGIAAMPLPTQRKRIYVPVSILVAFLGLLAVALIDF